VALANHPNGGDTEKKEPWWGRYRYRVGYVIRIPVPRRYMVVIFWVRADERQPCSLNRTQSMRHHLTAKSSPMANVRHTMVLLDDLRLVVQLEGATRGRAGLSHAPAGITAAAVTRLRACKLDARSQLAAASAQPAAVTTKRVPVARFSIVHAYPESGYV
jgi:hypothetical protein